MTEVTDVRERDIATGFRDVDRNTEQTVRDLAVPSDLKAAEVNGASLAYREQGTGQPVVFVHGSISDLTIWHPQLSAVGARYRAIAFSRRYAWPNQDLPRGDKDTMGPHVDDLLAFLRAVDADPAHLVGNSYGAYICVKAAIREPVAVRSLVLEEPPVVPLITGMPPSPARLLSSCCRHPVVLLAVMRMAVGLRQFDRMIRSGDVDAAMLFFARANLGADAFDRLPDEVRAHVLANASASLGTFLAGFQGVEPISEAEIRSIKAPALVVTGAQSPLWLRRLAGLLHTLLPDSRCLEVPSATHFMHLQNPVALNVGLLRFLADVNT